MIQKFKDRQKRTIFIAAAGFLVDFLYVFYHGVLGAVNCSIWFGTMCAYYLILAAMRFFAVLYSCKSGSESSKAWERTVVKLFGVLILLLSVVVAGVIYLSLSQNIAAQYDAVVMITIATYTFTKIIAAAVQAVRGRKNRSQLAVAIRYIRYAEVSASVFTMQKSMLVSFEGMSQENMHMMNILTGSAVWLFMFVLGIKMVRKAGNTYGKI